MMRFLFIGMITVAVLLHASCDSISEKHVMVKRGMIEDMITAGDGTVCKYIIKYCFYLAQNELSKLVAYLQANIMGKRGIDEFEFQRIKKRDITDVFNSIVNGSRGISCKLVIQFLKSSAHKQFNNLITYLTSNIASILGK